MSRPPINKHPYIPGLHMILTGSIRAAMQDIDRERRVIDYPVNSLNRNFASGETAFFEFQILSLDNLSNLDRLRGTRATSYSLHPSALDPAWRWQLSEARKILRHRQAEELRPMASFVAPGVVEIPFKIDPTDPRVASLVSIVREMARDEPVEAYSLLISCLACEITRQDGVEAQVAEHVAIAIDCLRAAALLRDVGQIVP